MLTPSLALTSIAAATPANWRVRYWDENLLQGPPPADPLPQVVGITVHLTFARRAYELAAWYRARGSTVVLGGMHVNTLPGRGRAARRRDQRRRRRADLAAILRDVERGTLQPRYEATFDRDYDLDPPPRRDLLPRDVFLTTTSVIATRGCRNRCALLLPLDRRRCACPTASATRDDVARQIRGRRPALLSCSWTTTSARAATTCARSAAALRPLEKIWSAAVTLDVTDDPSLVREMALAGCTGVFIGFETLNDENLAHARKRTPRAEDYARRVRIFHDHGIQVNGSFVVGFDGDRRDTFATLAQWIEAHRLECATFHILTPYPGTPLFRAAGGGGPAAAPRLGAVRHRRTSSSGRST